MELFSPCPSIEFLRRTVRLIRSTRLTSSRPLAATQIRLGVRVGGGRTRISQDFERPFDSTSRTQKSGSGLTQGFRPSCALCDRGSTRWIMMRLCCPPAKRHERLSLIPCGLTAAYPSTSEDSSSPLTPKSSSRANPTASTSRGVTTSSGESYGRGDIHAPTSSTPSTRPRETPPFSEPRTESAAKPLVPRVAAG